MPLSAYENTYALSHKTEKKGLYESASRENSSPGTIPVLWRYKTAHSLASIIRYGHYDDLIQEEEHAADDTHSS